VAPAARLKVWAAALLSVLLLWAFYVGTLTLFLSTLAQQSAANATGGSVWPWGLGLGSAAILLSSLGAPPLLDRLLGVKWMTFDEAGDVGPYLRELLERQRCAMPRLGVMVESSPCIATYGGWWGGPRLIASSGLLSALDVDEQCAIFCHEVGHVASRDYVAATLLGAPMFLFALVLHFFEEQQRASPSRRPVGTAPLLAPLIAGLIRAHAWMYRPLEGLREREADAFVQAQAGEPIASSLSRARFHVLRALGSPAAGSRHKLARALAGFTPLDVRTAGRLCTQAAGAGDGLSDEALQRVLEWDQHNPYRASGMCASGEHTAAGCVATSSTLSVEAAVEAAARQRYTTERAVHLLPALGFVGGVAVALWVRGCIGLPLLLWGAGRLAVLAFDFRASRETMPALADVLRDAPRYWGMAWRFKGDGRVAGYGVPQQTWSENPVLDMEGAYLPMRFRSPLGLSDLPPLASYVDEANSVVGVRGWLRVRDVPYVEVHRVEMGGRTAWAGYQVPLQTLAALAVLALGLLILGVQWLGI
jgi:Zn-dependent protease with chaperone function